MSPLSILIVDDSQTTRAMIARIIGMMGVQVAPVLEAGDGKQALALLRAKHVDLILADLNMPVMDGFEMIGHLSKDPALRHIPVVVISAQPDPEVALLLKRDGVVAYLEKPFTAERIRDVVKQTMENRPAEKPPAETNDAPFNMLLAEALASALETMAYISPELISAECAPTLPKNPHVVTVNFAGQDTKGALTLAVPPDFTDLMAESDNLPSTIPIDDALMELANITCGKLLRMRPGGGVGFHLDPPTLMPPGDARAIKLFDAGDAVTLQAEGRLIAAKFATDDAFYGI